MNTDNKFSVVIQYIGLVRKIKICKPAEHYIPLQTCRWSKKPKKCQLFFISVKFRGKSPCEMILFSYYNIALYMKLIFEIAMPTQMM